MAIKYAPFPKTKLRDCDIHLPLPTWPTTNTSNKTSSVITQNSYMTVYEEPLSVEPSVCLDAFAALCAAIACKTSGGGAGRNTEFDLDAGGVLSAGEESESESDRGFRMVPEVNSDSGMVLVSMARSKEMSFGDGDDMLAAEHCLNLSQLD